MSGPPQTKLVKPKGGDIRGGKGVGKQIGWIIDKWLGIIDQ